MINASLSLQRALYAALIADADVLAALGGAKVFDHAPHNTAFPYITFSSVEARAWNTADTEGAQHSITLEAWSDGKGRRQVLAILSAVEKALVSPIAPDGHTLVLLQSERLSARRSADGRTYQASLVLKALTEKTA